MSIIQVYYKHEIRVFMTLFLWILEELYSGKVVPQMQGQTQNMAARVFNAQGKISVIFLSYSEKSTKEVEFRLG